MKKKNEFKRWNYYALGGIAIFALIAVFSTATAGEGTFLDRLLALTSDKYAAKLAEKTDVGELTEAMFAGASPDHYYHNTFKENISIGGQSYATSSTATTYTLTTTEIPSDRSTSLLVWTPNINTTLTTMATSSSLLSGLDVGESFTMYLYNASTTAASTITLGAGAGVDLQEDEGESVIVNGLEIARLTFLRVANKDAATDVVLWVEVGQVGD